MRRGRGEGVFHMGGGFRKEAEYLLKTKSFPHCPHGFPQEFSTAVNIVDICYLVDIKLLDRKRPDSNFFAGRNYYQIVNFCAKITPLTEKTTHSPMGKLWKNVRCGKTPVGGMKIFRKTENFFEKGIDFMRKSRYNVNLYENNEKGDATHAQH